MKFGLASTGLHKMIKCNLTMLVSVIGVTLIMHVKAASYTCRMLNSTKRSLTDIKGCSIHGVWTLFALNKRFPVTISLLLL